MDKVIIVGAGLSGATIARLIAESGKDVIVYDRRENFGGNAYDYYDKNGILIQKYGPHIFHTKEKEVYDFLSKFTEWNKYEHKVTAKIRRKCVPVPFNLTSLFSLYPVEKAQRIKSVLIDEIGENKKITIFQLKSHQNPEIRDLADYIYKNIFYKYTKKQWGVEPEALNEEVLKRVPVYLSEEDRYFTDKYQYMPKNGFTEMIANILRHPKIQLKLKTDALKDIKLGGGKIFIKGKVFEGTMIFTGRVDELFNYKFGALPYRSLSFKFKTINRSSFQKTAVVNYTTSKNFTRISEFTKFTCPPTNKTVIVKEYSKKCTGKDIPYYPIPNDKNNLKSEQYKEEAKRYKKLYLLGRLAEYKYINMDIAILNAFNLYDKISDKL